MTDMTDEETKKMKAAWNKHFQLTRFSDKNFNPGPNPDFKAGYQAALKRNKPVAIEDIPEEWKDGRLLDVWHNRYVDHQRASGRFDQVDGKLWIGCCSVTSSYITHAMLPPSIEP